MTLHSVTRALSFPVYGPEGLLFTGSLGLHGSTRTHRPDPVDKKPSSNQFSWILRASGLENFQPLGKAV